MMKQLKHLLIEGAYNIRDLGGIPTIDGRSTRWNLLYRSDALSLLTTDGWQKLINYGVRTVIDLRSVQECEYSAIKPLTPIVYYHRSLMKQVAEMPEMKGLIQDSKVESTDSMRRIIKSMTVDYATAIRTNIECCVDVLQLIRKGLGRGSVLFLCSAGKDRTGIIASMILYLCQVAREDIVADYMVSSTYNQLGINSRMHEMYESHALNDEQLQLLKEALTSKPEVANQLYDEYVEMKIECLLDKHGFTKTNQQELIDLVCE